MGHVFSRITNYCVSTPDDNADGCQKKTIDEHRQNITSGRYVLRDSIEADCSDAPPLINASDRKRGNGAHNPGDLKGSSDSDTLKPPSTHDSDTDDGSEDDNWDSANGKKSKVQAALDRLEMSITAKLGRVREETVVEVAQHITEQFRKTHTYDLNVTKGVCVIYDDCSSEDDLSANVDCLYRQFSFFDVKKNVNDINSMNNENYDFFAIYILDVNIRTEQIIQNINEMPTDVPKLVVIEAKSETSTAVAEIRLRNTLVFKSVNRNLLMEFNNDLLVHSVTFDISSIADIAVNRATKGIKEHEGMCIEDALERKVFLQRKSDEAQD